jgi:putative phosphonate metabolism protein
VSGAPRYAIYFVPPADSALYRWGASLLGRDCYTGAKLAYPHEDLPDDWAELTQEPRRYGFHATLKAPFRLSPEHDEATLVAAVAAFGEQYRDIAVIAPVVRPIGHFIAVVSRTPSVPLDSLAADCVLGFDRFRAPMSAAERARRVASRLDEQERDNLERWGYPYVFEAFRFHMTLTGPLGDDRRNLVGNMLAALMVRDRVTAPVTIDRIALVRQDDEASPFRVLQATALRHREAAPSPT